MMYSHTMSIGSQRGSMLLSLSLLVFVVAVLACVVVGWLLWQDAGQSWPAWQQLVLHRSRPVSVSPTPTVDALRPSVTIDSALKNQAQELEDQLVTPLREYYATKSERLGTIAIMPSDKPNHSTKVSYQLMSGQDQAQTTFYYDRSGEDKQGPFPTWSPSLLDITQ